MSATYDPERETVDSRSAEDKARDAVAAATNTTLHRLAHTWTLDFCATRAGLVVAWVEVKSRPKPLYTRDFFLKNGFMLSLKKINMAKQLIDLTGKPFVLVVRPTCGTMWWRVFKSAEDLRDGYTLQFGGRNDRHEDINALEPVAMFHFEPFIVLKNAVPLT